MSKNRSLLIFIFVFVARSLAGINSFSAEDAQGSESPFGVLEFLSWTHDWNHHHYDEGKVRKAVSLMKEAGVGIVRFDFLWEDIEPEAGRFDFTKYDKLVDLLHENGIEVLGLLSYNPSWSEKKWNDPPDPALFVRYASRVAAHFKGRVNTWEIWNEPDHENYWTPQDDLKTYSALLREVYPVIKKENPEAQVVMGALTKTIPVGLRRLYKNGCKDCFDIVNIHPFVDPRQPNASALLRGLYKGTLKVMEANGDSEKPIWFTEIGCPGVADPASAPGWWLGRSTNEEEQARWVTKVYAEPLRWKGVEKIFWAFFRDTPNHFQNGIDFFGLVRGDFSKKPAFRAYQSAARSFTGKETPSPDDSGHSL